MASQRTDEKESSGESIIAITEALESVKIKIENDINDEKSQSSLGRRRHVSSHSSTRDSAIIPAMVSESMESMIKALQQSDDTKQMGEKSEQISSLETDSNVENRELEDSSCESTMNAINKFIIDRTKNEDLSQDLSVGKHSKSMYALMGKEDQLWRYKIAKYHIEQAMKCFNFSSDTTEPILETVVSDNETNSPNSPHSCAHADSNISNANISMPIDGDIETGNEQTFKCDKCDDQSCVLIESSDALKTHVEHVDGIIAQQFQHTSI